MSFLLNVIDFQNFGNSIVLTEFELYYIIRVKSEWRKKSTRRVRRARRAESENGNFSQVIDFKYVVVKIGKMKFF